MNIKYYRKTISDISETYTKGSRKIYYIENDTYFDFFKLNDKYDFYQIQISDLIKQDSKYRKKEINSEIKHIFKWYDIPMLKKSFYIKLVKVQINNEENHSRVLGVEKNKTIDNSIMNNLAENVLSIGINRSYSILDPSILDKSVFKILLFKKYLSNQTLQLIELESNVIENNFFQIGEV